MYGNNNNNSNNPSDPSSSSSLLRSRTRVSSSSKRQTNNFLLGGISYPEKRKRKKSWYSYSYKHPLYCWQRWRLLLVQMRFCPLRQQRYPSTLLCGVCIGKLLVVAFILLRGFLPVPGNSVQSTASSSSSSSSSAFLRRSSTTGRRNPITTILEEPLSSLLDLPTTIAQERRKHSLIAHARQQLEPILQKERMQILKDILPDFWVFHSQQDKREATKQQLATKKKEQANVAVSTSKQQLANSSSSLHIPPERILRTIHTMNDAVFANRTKCRIHNAKRSNSITASLVLQSTLDRLWIVEETCRRWKTDPIIVAVAIQSDQDRLSELTQRLQHHCPHVQLLYYILSAQEQEHPETYPVNYLRNMALDAVQTTHVLVADVDFVPSMQLDEQIRHVLQAQQQHDDSTSNEEALVVPAFERLETCVGASCQEVLLRNHSFLPQSFPELQHCVSSNECSVFQQANNRDGHGSTHSKDWLQGKWYNDKDDKESERNNKSARTITCFESLRYEPYVVIRWCPSTDISASSNNNNNPQAVQEVVPIAPYYDERFHGYGKNKIEHVSHLRLLGYQFRVLPEGFLVHNPHEESTAKEQWKNVDESDLHTSMDALYYKFLHELLDLRQRQNNTRHVVTQCHHNQKER